MTSFSCPSGFGGVELSCLFAWLDSFLLAGLGIRKGLASVVVLTFFFLT